MVLLREELGDVLRTTRRDQGRTLREVSGEAACSLGYLSEIERGEKEASSELLASVCKALDVSLSDVLSHVADRITLAETTETQMTAVLTEGLPQPIRPRRVEGAGRPSGTVVSAA